MKSFVIKDADGPGSLEFCDREPADPRLPMVACKVRLTDRGLSAEAKLYAEALEAPPTSLFIQMAESWKGWPGELAWTSQEWPVSLRASQDRAGHVSLNVSLRPGFHETEWTVEAMVMSEAGQLEEIATNAEAFFGLWPESVAVSS